MALESCKKTAVPVLVPLVSTVPLPTPPDFRVRDAVPRPGITPRTSSTHFLTRSTSILSTTTLSDKSTGISSASFSRSLSSWSGARCLNDTASRDFAIQERASICIAFTSSPSANATPDSRTSRESASKCDSGILGLLADPLIIV